MQLILNIKDESRLHLLTSMLAQFDFVEILRATNGRSKKRALTQPQQELLGELERSVRDINLHMQGKIVLKDARELLNEPI